MPDAEALLAVEIPEQPGSFLNFCGALGQHNVTEFNYRYQGADRARLFVGFGLNAGQENCAAVIARLTAAGYGVIDMSGNEMAKLHVRYMIGGAVTGSPTSCCSGSSFQSAPARCWVSSRPSGAPGTSRCFTTETTARTTVACSPALRYRAPDANCS